MSLPMTLNFKFEVKAGRTSVVLAGEVTEGTDFSVLGRHLPDDFAFDLSGISRFNSFGVLNWTRFLGQLRDAGKKFTLERCSPAVVAQLNMIANFAAGAEVRSIQAPFFCDSCKAEHTVELDLGPDAFSKLEANHNCPRCGESMEFDDVAATYLFFHTQASTPKPKG